MRVNTVGLRPALLPTAMLCLAIGLVPAAVPALAQVATASLSGEVIDPSGAAVPGADVTVTAAVGGAVRRTTADAEGRFELRDLPPGRHAVVAEHPGLLPAVIPNVVLAPGGSRTVDPRAQAAGHPRGGRRSAARRPRSRSRALDHRRPPDRRAERGRRGREHLPRAPDAARRGRGQRLRQPPDRARRRTGPEPHHDGRCRDPQSLSPLRPDERVQPRDDRQLRAHHGRLQRAVRRSPVVDSARRQPPRQSRHGVRRARPRCR